MGSGGCGFTCMKYLTFIFNLIFFLSGLIILGAGTAILIAMNKSSSEIYNDQKGGVILVIVIGCIITFVAFFGCRGAINESYCNLMTFVALLVALLILEIAAVIICYIYRDKIHNANKEPLESKWSKYDPNNRKDISTIVDTIQEEFECCGVNNSTDWAEIPWGKTNGIPISCCKKSLRKDGCANDLENINLEGCHQHLKNVLENEVLIIAAIAIGVALIHVFGIVFACCLAKAIKKNSEEVAPAPEPPKTKLPNYITIKIMQPTNPH